METQKSKSNEEKSYAAQVELRNAGITQRVWEVLEKNHPDIAKGNSSGDIELSIYKKRYDQPYDSDEADGRFDTTETQVKARIRNGITQQNSPIITLVAEKNRPFGLASAQPLTTEQLNIIHEIGEIGFPKTTTIGEATRKIPQTDNVDTTPVRRLAIKRVPPIRNIPQR